MPSQPIQPSLTIRAEHVEKRYGSTAVLTDVDCQIGTGVTGLLGANGAGKTTFLGLVLGLHRVDAGSLEVLGFDPAVAGPEVRARIGYSPEHHNLPPDVQAADLVRHLARMHGLPRRAAAERASDALWQVGLGEERFRPIGTMSTGQRQRVKLAAAIAHDPHLVLLDEPTDGLDPLQRDDMLALIRQIGHELGMSIVLSSHLLAEVELICDDVVILADGRVMRSGRLASMRGAITGLTIEVDDKIDELAERLRLDGTNVERAGQILVVIGTASLDGIRDHIADLGVGVRRLEPRTTTLEDAYLEAQSS